MTIRWGVSPIAWCNDDMRELGGDTTLDELLTDVRDIGFDGVELGNKFPRDPEVLAPIMAGYGLDVVGGWYSSNLLVRDADAEIAALSKHLALLEYMDSSVFILAETSNAVHGDRTGSRLDTHPVLPAADWKQFGERLNTVARFITDRGLRFAYHHHLGTVVETKDELMLALTERVAGEKIDEVAERVAVLQERGEDLEPGALVRQLLDVAFDKKQGILLTSEIRTRAMRDPRLAETYVAWQTGMVERIGSFIEELALTYGFRLRVPAREFAGLILQTWEDTSAFAVMTGLSAPAMHQLVNERTARLVTALVDPV